MGLGPGPSPPMPVPPVERGAALAKMFPMPRLFLITNTMDGKATGTAQFCMGADSIARQLDSLSAIAKDPKLTAGCTHTVDHKAEGATHVVWSCPKGAGLMGPGCTQTIDRTAEGGVRIEMTCDKAAGASRAMHMTMEADGQMKEMRQHMELPMDMLQPPRTLVSETHMVQAGDCPADLKPGEARMADGTKIDLTAMFARSGVAKPTAPTSK